ncbi:hypothetical protein CBO05C_2026 [Clostridium botulinum B str. Osaka05]|uniref:Endonuclease GajA/Old nuclease/RecF-like AAA domain-containing protein n=1 Tax=Clostridium botulinum B str. Osaka05 TaxID=1407017 RepID=A0A0S6U430_CLOBO|nr:AAA family ATPase [Clostridium botulinum]GAE02336.1 hypothetical protein CBO05C_2026 [Clostridium botulinum B str. Osaka05]
MRIRTIALKNWRSYDDVGVEVSELNNINIIIGINNSGKSNLFKYLYYLKKLISNTLINNNDGSSEIILKKNYSLYNNLEFSFKDEDIWAWKDGIIECEILVESDESNWKYGKPKFVNGNNIVKLKTRHNKVNNRSTLSVMCNDKELIEKEARTNPKILDISTEQYRDIREDIEEAFDTFKYWKKFSESIIFIDPCRHYDRECAKFMECDFDGSSIVNEIVNINKNEIQTWIKYRNSIQKWLSEILMEDIKVNISAEPSIRFEVIRGNREILLTLNELGTGVSQIFMILSYLFINKHRSMNIFIEEPECNLHPDAVIKSVEIFENEFKNDIFFITTHSSSLIDRINNKWSVHRVYRGENKQSLIQTCKSVVQKYELLDELGIKASQLLQSNIIIWVEGPSDRIYLNKWISDISDRKFIEGIHYSYIMYGGANLKLYDIIGSDEYINVISTSRYSYIVCDSDKKKENSKLKDRVKKILDSLEKLGQNRWNTQKNIKDYIKVWVTKGREIENYIPKKCFKEILSKDEFTKKYFRKPEKVELEVDKNLIDGVEFIKYDSFDEFFSKMYKIDGQQLSSQSDIKKISEHYSSKKVEIAKAVVENWNEDYYSENLDLIDKINELIVLINKANGIK